jgi:uncharacterized protein (TIGR00297 family)
MFDLLVGFVISFAIAYGGYKKEALSFSGAASAAILGTSLYYFGGIYFSAILVAFFISSSILTKYRKEFKRNLEDVNEKGGKRDYIQVAANGMLGFVFALLFYITNNHIFILAYGTAFAAANSDTWASELGVLSNGRTFSIINFRKIEKGMSGGVSILGITASILGAGFIGVIYAAGYLWVFGFTAEWVKMLFLCSFGGFMGSIIDSFFGATVQVKYRCVTCGKLTEKRTHHGKPASKVSGIEFINNDVVNFTSGLLASLISIGLYVILK